MQYTQAQSYYLQTLQKRAYSDDKELKRQRFKKKGWDKRKEKKRKFKRERKKKEEGNK